MKRIITRRNFIKSTASAAMGAAVGISPFQKKEARVVLIRNQNVWSSENGVDPQIVQNMLDEAVKTLFDVNNSVDAFKKIVKPGYTVGIKSNAWRFLPTPPELESAITKRLIETGVEEDKISVDDKRVRRNPIFQNADVLINVRPLRTHHWSGIGGCLKNPITFTKKPSDYHDDSCADMATFWELPAIKGKVKLNILSLLNPQFHGRGPHHFDKRYVWKYCGIMVSVDPVAVDAVGLDLINKKRIEHFGRRRALATSPKHVRMADERHSLGISDLNKIELIKLGWQEGSLI